MVTVDLADGQHSSEIKLSDINMVVEVRSREIIENIYARMEDAGVAKDPGYSIVIAGNGAALKNMREALSERFRDGCSLCFRPERSDCRRRDDCQ